MSLDILVSSVFVYSSLIAEMSDLEQWHKSSPSQSYALLFAY